MNMLLPEIVNLLQNFMWPFVRVSVVLLAAPLFGMEAVNVRVRIAIGFVLTWMIFPLIEVPEIDPLSIFAIQFMLNEIIVGAMMGLTLQVVTAAIITSGQAVSSSMGLGMANMVDPNLGNVPTLSQFFMVISMLIFLALGGHLVIISILVQSFTSLPIGAGLANTNAIQGFLVWSSQIFIGALSLVLPIILGLLMVNVCLGVISRASPSLNVFAVGFPALIPLGFGMVIITMGFIASRMESLWFAGFQVLNENLLGL
ncbi:MAG: flagellar biosynthetic protein FliR [Pseudomonadales bacterium]|jgi:flagellar biosynthetic protein FliR|nr:flagellar biosynthetic protein FliR [Pseudomonadales bacterium]